MCKLLRIPLRPRTPILRNWMKSLWKSEIKCQNFQRKKWASSQPSWDSHQKSDLSGTLLPIYNSNWKKPIELPANGNINRLSILNRSISSKSNFKKKTGSSHVCSLISGPKQITLINYQMKYNLKQLRLMSCRGKVSGWGPHHHNIQISCLIKMGRLVDWI